MHFVIAVYKERQVGSEIIRGMNMKMLREELTTEGAMRVLKGLGGDTFRTDQVLVMCSNKAQEMRVAETALSMQRNGYVARVIDAKSPEECWVVIAFKQPDFRAEQWAHAANDSSGLAPRHARQVGATAI